MKVENNGNNIKVEHEGGVTTTVNAGVNDTVIVKFPNLTAEVDNRGVVTTVTEHAQRSAGLVNIATHITGRIPVGGCVPNSGPTLNEHQMSVTEQQEMTCIDTETVVPEQPFYDLRLTRDDVVRMQNSIDPLIQFVYKYTGTTIDPIFYKLKDMLKVAVETMGCEVEQPEQKTRLKAVPVVGKEDPYRDVRFHYDDVVPLLVGLETMMTRLQIHGPHLVHPHVMKFHDKLQDVYNDLCEEIDNTPKQVSPKSKEDAEQNPICFLTPAEIAENMTRSSEDFRDHYNLEVGEYYDVVTRHPISLDDIDVKGAELVHIFDKNVKPREKYVNKYYGSKAPYHAFRRNKVNRFVFEVSKGKYVVVTDNARLYDIRLHEDDLSEVEECSVYSESEEAEMDVTTDFTLDFTTAVAVLRDLKRTKWSEETRAFVDRLKQFILDHAEDFDGEFDED